MSIVAPAAAALELTVGADQLVHLTGSSDSLRSVVETLCARAGIELRGYDAPDRAFVGSYRGLSAQALLPRLLREESHAIGVHSGDERGSTRIAWLRVLGTSGSATSTAAVRPMPQGAAPAPEAEPPPMTPAQTFEADKGRVLDLLRPALESDEREREAALREIARKLAQEPESREPLLGATQTNIAEELAQYADARQVMMALQLEIRDEEARRNFERIVQQLNVALQKQTARR